MDLGIQSAPKEAIKEAKVVILVGADNNLSPADIPQNAFVIYIGTHGDEGALYADIVLPSAAYSEKDATYVNTEGRP